MNKWLGGITAAIIAGVAIYYLTEGLPDLGKENPPGKVSLFEHANFSGREIILEQGDPPQIEDLKRNSSYSFGDQITSLKWSILKGCRMNLYQHDHFRKLLKTIHGEGEIPDLKSASNKISSLKWVC